MCRGQRHSRRLRQEALLQEQAQSCQAAVESLLEADGEHAPGGSAHGSASSADTQDEADAGAKNVRFGGHELVRGPFSARDLLSSSVRLTKCSKLQAGTPACSSKSAQFRSCCVRSQHARLSRVSALLKALRGGFCECALQVHLSSCSLRQRQLLWSS